MKNNIDLDQTLRFLNLLAGSIPVTYQTYDDDKKKDKKLAKIIHEHAMEREKALQELLHLSYIGVCLANIALPFWRVFRLYIGPEYLIEFFYDIHDGCRSPACHVKNLSGYVGHNAGIKVRLDDIAYKCKVSRLLAVPFDQRRLAIEHFK